MARHGSGSYSMYNEGHRSPPYMDLAPQNKREKRRNQLKERLQDMMATFSRDHQEHYYAQLIGLQCDMNLIMRADNYANMPLDDDPHHVQQMINEARQEVIRGRDITQEGEPSFYAFAGRYYNKLVADINAALERRDVDLTEAHKHYHESLDEIKRTQQYKTQLAHEEHRILVQTVRERLIQQTVRKKERLIREKEQLDIGDSSALLLNPAQFSIGNPASPGGPQNPRKTRGTRLRPDEDGYGADSAKRKRKAPADEEEHQSPAPSIRPATENKTSTPFKDAKAKAFYTQQEAPLFSISNLFTEKELAFNLTQAHAEANGFFARAKALSNSSAPISVNGVNGAVLDTATTASVDGVEGADNDVPMNGSPSMTPAIPVHATRSSNRTNPLNDLANAAITSAPFFATVAAVPLINSKGNPPRCESLPGLNDADLNSDLQMMRMDPSEPLLNKLAERCVEKAGPIAVSDADVTGRLGVPLGLLNGTNGTNGVVANAAALQMQRQEHGMGLGLELGGAAMARERSSGCVSDFGEGISAADFGAAQSKAVRDRFESIRR